MRLQIWRLGFQRNPRGQLGAGFSKPGLSKPGLSGLLGLGLGRGLGLGLGRGLGLTLPHGLVFNLTCSFPIRSEESRETRAEA